MQHFLQVESTPPASSGHKSEILLPIWREGEGRRGGGVRGEEVSENRGGESEGKASYCGPGAVGVWKPVCLFALEQLKA